jgi:hypothetical protein
MARPKEIWYVPFVFLQRLPAGRLIDLRTNLFAAGCITYAGSAAPITLNVPRFIVALVLTVWTPNLQHIFRDESALFIPVIDYDLDRFLTPVASETKIKAVGRRFH